MTFTYRKSDLQDGEAVYALICGMEQRRLPFDKFSNIYQRQLNDPRYYCLVCECENAVAGMLNLRFEEQLHHAERIAEIMEFAVDPAYRKGGIGKELFARACQLAKGRGCTQVEAACNQLRTGAHRFYLREEMRNFHYKFSKSLIGPDAAENSIGK